MRKNWSSDREFFLKFKTEGQEFAKNLRSLEIFVVGGVRNMQEKLENKEYLNQT